MTTSDDKRGGKPDGAGRVDPSDAETAPPDTAPIARRRRAPPHARWPDRRPRSITGSSSQAETTTGCGSRRCSGAAAWRGQPDDLGSPSRWRPNTEPRSRTTPCGSPVSMKSPHRATGVASERLSRLRHRRVRRTAVPVDGVDGKTSRRRSPHRPPPEDRAIEIAWPCAAPAAAHERGVVHRDSAEVNIMPDGGKSAS